MTLQEIVKLRLRIVHIQLLIAILVDFFFIFVFILIIVEVFNILLITFYGIFILHLLFSLLCLIVDDLIILIHIIFILILFLLVILNVCPVLGVCKLFGCNFYHWTLLTCFHLLLELLKLLLTFISLLLPVTLSFLGFFDIDFELVAQVIRKLQIVVLRCFLVHLSHYFQLIEEKATLRELDMTR